MMPARTVQQLQLAKAVAAARTFLAEAAPVYLTRPQALSPRLRSSAQVDAFIRQQRPDGDLSGGCEQPMYAHGLATIVLCEAYGMTRDERVGAAARLAGGRASASSAGSTGGSALVWRSCAGCARGGSERRAERQPEAPGRP